MPKTGLIIKFQSATSTAVKFGNPADNIKASAMEHRTYLDDFVEESELLQLSEQPAFEVSTTDIVW